MAKSSRSTPRRGKRRTRRPSRPRRRWWLRGLLMTVIAGLVVVGGYVAWLDHRVTTAFEGKRWSLPARVYARPLELYPGKHLSPQNLVRELRAADYQPVERVSGPGVYSRSGDRFRLRTRDFRFWDGHEPSRFIEVRFDGGDRLVGLRDLDSGRPLNLVRVDPAHIGNIHPTHHEDRDLVQLRDVPRPLVQGLIAVEDYRFPEHFGISLRGILRAVIANIRAGHVVQGGSTLTQQLVKNFYLTSEQTLWRKAREAVMAILLELHYSKAEILEAYMNEVYLGQDGNRAIHGFGLGSRFYFGEPLQELDLAEQALLVGLIKGPSYYDPRRHPERARERRALVLDEMVRRGYVAEGDAAEAKRQALGVAARPDSSRTPHPAFMDLVRQHLARDYRASDLMTEGLRIFTTLAPHVQQSAEQALARRTAEWGKGMQGAVVGVDVDNGEVEAIVGGRDASFAGFNRALNVRRPIGSLIKPAVYLTALARPGRYGLGTLVADRPVTLQDASGRRWHPENYDHEYLGDIPLWWALADSRNAATVHLGLDLGLRAVVDTVDRLGGRVPDTVYPSMLLGAVNQSPLDVAGMYETLATGGFRTPLRSVRAVMTPDGRVLSRYELTVERAFDSGPVYLLDHALQRVVRQGTARALDQWVEPSLRIAGKTGTTDNLRDSWFAGFSGDTLAVVWVGRDDNGRTGLTGSSGAMTVWGEMFAELEPRPLPATAPDGVNPVWIDRRSGLRAASYCEGAIQLPYLEGTAPSETASCVNRRSVVERAGDWLEGWFE